MENNHLWLFVSLSFSLTISFGAGFWCSKGHTHMECVSEGFVEYKCDQSREKYVKHKFHQCPKDKTACKCFEDWDTEDTPQACECISAKRRPDFPSTGVIRWNGSYVYDEEHDNDYEGPRTTYLPGEVHKDKHGRYLMKKTAVHDWPYKKAPVKRVEFEIILPNYHKRTFTKYTGNTRSKDCKIEEVKDEGELISIWKDDPRKYYHLIEEKPKTKHIVTHVWYQEVPADYEGEEWKFTIDYDTNTHHAIPVAYNYEFVDHWGYIRKSINLNYTYEPIGDNDESFKLEEYCPNV